MKQKKVFIISLNNLTTAFWKNTLNLEDVSLWHWKISSNGINNLTTIWPDVIIIDSYWAKECHLPCLRKVLSIISSAKIYCLTPLPKGDSNSVLLDSRLFVSKLDNEIIKDINNTIHNSNSEKGYKKTA